MQILSYERFAKDDNIYSYFFKIFSNGKEKSVMIKLSNNELLDWGCDCEFGATYRFTEKNRSNDTKCKHYKKAIELLKYLGEIDGSRDY